MKKQYIQRAIQIAKDSIHNNGGPFGAVIVKDNEIIAEGNNCVTHDNDPTAHAEIVAIRRACSKQKTFQLDDCILYTSSEPCPMCLAAIYWAHISEVYYVNSHAQASAAGFDDSFIYSELALPHESKKLLVKQSTDHETMASGNEIFQLWQDKNDKVIY